MLKLCEIESLEQSNGEIILKYIEIYKDFKTVTVMFSTELT